MVSPASADSRFANLRIVVQDAADDPIGFHPLADIFPLIEGAEFGAFTADVREHGLHEPIVLFDGLILDGRNRYRACIAACIDPRFETYAGSDPVGYVVSLNLRRRHLSESQRAMVAARLANLGEGRPSVNSANLQSSVSQANAAKLLNVSTRSVASATQVRNEGAPELISAVDRGEVSVSAAADVAKRTARIAMAKGAHDGLVSTAYHLKADALAIEHQAACRLADEYDAAQERGEIKSNGGARNFTVPNESSELPNAAELGISRKDIFEARQVRDAEKADPGIVRRTLNEQIERGEEPTNAAIKQAIVNRTSFTGNNQWFTPETYLTMARDGRQGIRAQQFIGVESIRVQGMEIKVGPGARNVLPSSTSLPAPRRSPRRRSRRPLRGRSGSR